MRPTGSGINKTTHFVDTPSRSYFLCIYQECSAGDQVRREHALLGALASAGLPFAVPAPIPTRGGETLVAVPGGDRVATLFDVIRGRAPDRTDPRHIRAVGEALGHLHRALAAIDLGPDSSEHVTYGMLGRIHPRVPDPISAPDDLPLGSDERARLRRILEGVIEAVPTLYATLPVQLCHCDYGPGNTLFVGDRVSGVLDFEFAGPDLRAIDTATGWYWSQSRWADDPWTPIAAFAAGYRAVLGLTEAEIAAAPALARLERAAGLVHWVGRLRAGQADPAFAREQGERLLAVDAFVAENGRRLVEALAAGT